MAELVGSVSSSDALWTVDTLPTSTFLLAEDEIVEITADFAGTVRRENNEVIPPRIRVRRGASGTTAASHADGTALESIYAPSVGGAGVEQTIRLLGPFPVAFDAAGITGNGALATSAIPAGALVTLAWAELVSSWIFGEPATLVLAVAPNSDPGNTYLVTQYNTIADEITAQGDATIGLEATTNPVTSVDIAPYRCVARCVEASRLVVQTGVAATAGEADIYVLIAEPA